MAKKPEKPKTVLERTYNIPLRREWLKAPKWKRTKKAVKAAKEFLQRHMKSENVKLGRYLNEELWKKGIKNPPHHIKVDVKKDEEGNVFAELAGAPKVEEKKEEKPKKPVKPEMKKEEIKEKKKEEKAEEAKEEKEKVVVEKEKPEEPKKEKVIVEKKTKTKEKEPKKEEKEIKQVEELAQQVLKKGSTK